MFVVRPITTTLTVTFSSSYFCAKDACVAHKIKFKFLVIAYFFQLYITPKLKAYLPCYTITSGELGELKERNIDIT